MRFTFIGKESSTAILAVSSRAGSPCHVENNLPTKMSRTRGMRRENLFLTVKIGKAIIRPDYKRRCEKRLEN